MRRVLAPLLLCLALAPSAWLAWRSRDAPHLGHFHDDSLYWVSARSLAAGAGYRIQSLPGEPFQTKYPPLYPLLLAAVWKLNPAFPDNLALAVLSSWLTLVACLLVARVAFRDLGAGPTGAWVLCAVLALSPFYALCGISLLSELLFASLSLAALALIQRARGAGLAAVAGLVASAAWLTRTQGLLLLAVGPLVFLLARQYRRAAAFALAMLPAVAGWMLWTHTHRLARPDAMALYYTDYLGYWVHVGTPRNLTAVLWTNLDGLLSAIGGMFVFGLGESLAAKTSARILAVAAIVGTARLARRPGATAYVGFTAACLLALLPWHYPPDQRFIVPVFPVLLAGFAAELLRLAGKLRAALLGRATGERIMAGAISLTLAGLLVLAGWRAYRGLLSGLPAFVAQHRAALAEHQAAYRWIAASTPPDAAVLAYLDPVLYLYTGRKACRLVISPMLTRPGSRRELQAVLDGVAGYARREGLSYALLTPEDLQAELPDQDRLAAGRSFRANPALERVFESGGVSVCRIR